MVTKEFIFGPKNGFFGPNRASFGPNMAYNCAADHQIELVGLHARAVSRNLLYFKDDDYDDDG